GDLKFFGADTALKPGGRAYLLFAAYDQYGFRVTDPELLGGERGIDTVFSEPGIFNDKPSLDKFFDYDDDGYVDLSLEVSPDVKVDKQVNLMLLSRIYGEPASVTLKVVLSKIPASVEFDYSDTLTIGDEDEYIPIIVKDAEGKELSPEDIVNAETTGRLQVTGSNQLVLESDPPTRTDYSVTPN
ncbi:S-layer homology domain-containing protein, partial [Paenibacillus sepulcri]|nr:S-layer homology domain-containing protein [Paenibacillus sepulcri]